MTIEALSVDNLREGVFCAAGKPHSEEWYEQLEAWLAGGALHGAFARDESGEPQGFTLYFPLEKAPVEIEGKGYYMLQCVYVRPKFQGSGIGKALIEWALADARSLGATGVVAEGFTQGVDGAPPASFFQSSGMTAAASRGIATLYYTAFESDASAPRYTPPGFTPPREGTKIRVDILDCSRCYHSVNNRAVVEVVMEQIDLTKVSVHVHDQRTREAVLDKGMSSGVFVDGKLTFFQGPVSEEDVLHALSIAIANREEPEQR